MPSSFVHDPDERLDYTFDWSNWLDDEETITDYDVSVPMGLTKGTTFLTNSRAVTVWISGGALGQTYRVTCGIKTSDGREPEKSMTLIVKSK